MFTFIETKLFTKLVQEYLSDKEYAQLQQALILDPVEDTGLSISSAAQKK
jgi:hypothetical protein